MTTYYLPYDTLTEAPTGAFAGFTASGADKFNADVTAAVKTMGWDNTNLSVGYTYRISFDLTINSGTMSTIFGPSVSTGSTPSSTLDTITSSGSYSYTYTHTDSADDAFAFQTNSTTVDFTVTNFKVKYANDITPETVTLTPITLAQTFDSPFTGHHTSYIHQGQYWKLEMTMHNLKNKEAKLYKDFFAKLNHSENDFYFIPLLEKDITVYGGTQSDVTGITTDGSTSSQSGSIAIQGLDTSESDVLTSGTYVEIDSQLFYIKENATSDGSGDTTLSVWPNTRETIADATAVRTAYPRGTFKLVSGAPSFKQLPGGITAQFLIVAREVL